MAVCVCVCVSLLRQTCVHVTTGIEHDNTTIQTDTQTDRRPQDSCTPPPRASPPTDGLTKVEREREGERKGNEGETKEKGVGKNSTSRSTNPRHWPDSQLDRQTDSQTDTKTHLTSSDAWRMNHECVCMCVCVRALSALFSASLRRTATPSPSPATHIHTHTQPWYGVHVRVYGILNQARLNPPASQPKGSSTHHVPIHPSQ